jgi:hypothetical protein
MFNPNDLNFIIGKASPDTTEEELNEEMKEGFNMFDKIKDIVKSTGIGLAAMIIVGIVFAKLLD